MSRPISTESIFRAIAHPTRRRLLEMIARDQWPATDLYAHFRHTPSTLSNHMRVLEGTGLVRHERRGRSLVYTLTPGALSSVAQWLRKLPGPATKLVVEKPQ